MTEKMQEILTALRRYYDDTGDIPKSTRSKEQIGVSKATVRRHFGSWNQAIEIAGIPLARTKPRVVRCAECGSECTRTESEIRKTKRSFCSRSCSAKFNNRVRPRKVVTKQPRPRRKSKSVWKTTWECTQCQDPNLGPEDFYLRANGKSHSWCKRCANDSAIKRQKALKRRCIDYKGGKCEICGYSHCSSALEFHHADPSEKDMDISALVRAKKVFCDEVKQELEKCHLLCCRCHREAHAGLHPAFIT